MSLWLIFEGDDGPVAFHDGVCHEWDVRRARWYTALSAPEGEFVGVTKVAPEAQYALAGRIPSPQPPPPPYQQGPVP